MGRVAANTASYQHHQFQVQTPDHQATETIDEIHPVSVEPRHRDLYPEENQNEPSPLASQELTLQSKAQDLVQQQQSVLLAPPPSPLQPTPALSPQPISMPVTTAFQQQNTNMNVNSPTQRNGQQPQPQGGSLRSLPPGQHESFPVHDPQPQAEAFPPPQPQSSPQAFPHANHELHTFPSAPTSAHAFPPPQTQPQSFVPQNHFVPAFASSQPQTGAMVQQPNWVQYPQAANGVGQGAQGGQGMGYYQQGMPPASPMQQAAMMGTPQNRPNEFWKTGLFGCMDDPTNALITLCFPCVTFGQIAEIVDSGQTSCGTSGLIYAAISFCIAMPCLMSFTYRSKLRSQYGLIESPGPDWVIHCFCELCALCQEYRELQLRGLDPSIGWQGNLARLNMHQGQTTMIPPGQVTMNP